MTTPTDPLRDLAARHLASLGGRARAASLTPTRRSEIARASALARWARPRVPRAQPPLTPADWHTAALAAVRALCETPRGAGLTSEDVLAMVGAPPGPRAVGNVLRAAARAGLIEASGEYRASGRPGARRHANRVRVWRFRRRPETDAAP